MTSKRGKPAYVARTVIVERIAYKVFAIRGGKLLKTWARIGSALKPITATTEEKLRKKLRKISVDLLNGQTDAAQLDAGDHRSYLAMREMVASLGLTPETALREFVAAVQILGSPSRLLEAARHYQQRSGALFARKLVADAIDAFLPTIARKSEEYRRVFKQDLARLRAFHGAAFMDALTVLDLTHFVNQTGHQRAGEFVPAGEWRRKQVRGELITFWRFGLVALRCVEQVALPVGKRIAQTVAEAVPIEDTICEAREVWDPEHLRRALEGCAAHFPQWLPFLALGSLANVRSTPTRRLDWSRLHRIDSLIELPARSSKVRKRVTVRISPELASWLDPVRKASGLITPAEEDTRGFARRIRALGIPYYKNVLRRSYITYLLALTDDEEMVARLANTSVQKLRENYRQIRTFAGRLVTKDLAEKWFGTSRVIAENVVQLELGA